MDVTPETGPRPVQPRSERDAAFLKRFNARMTLPIIVSAILPLVVVPESNGWVGIVVGIVTWLVFLADYLIQVRHLEHYGRTRLGRFDLFVVIATAPWFLLPGAQATQFAVLLRLARLARLVVASRGSRRLFDRLGRVAAVAVGIVLLGSLVAYHAEHPVNPEFATVGDALWWGVVTLTTVGYGDIVPKTPTGRWAAVTIMITGIAVLGVLAGSLASFFRLDENKNGAGSPAGEPTSTAATSDDAALRALTAEMAALRRQVEALTQQLAGTHHGQTPAEPPPRGDSEATQLPVRVSGSWVRVRPWRKITEVVAAVRQQAGCESGPSSPWHRPHQAIRRGCRVHVVPATWMRHPCRIRGGVADSDADQPAAVCAVR